MREEISEIRRAVCDGYAARRFHCPQCSMVGYAVKPASPTLRKTIQRLHHELTSKRKKLGILPSFLVCFND